MVYTNRKVCNLVASKHNAGIEKQNKTKVSAARHLRKRVDAAENAVALEKVEPCGADVQRQEDVLKVPTSLLVQLERLLGQCAVAVGFRGTLTEGGEATHAQTDRHKP